MVEDAVNVDASPPRRRVIVLGASNVARSFSTIVATAEQAWREPLDLLAALGHGRSFGNSNFVLGRTLPGILPCGLWSALADRPPLPAVAVVTDIGNDLLYGVDARQVAQWVERCLALLSSRCQDVLVTCLPMQGIRGMRAEQFRLMRSLFFPRSRLSFSQAIESAEELNARLRTLAQQTACRLLDPEPAWYGWDPIHIRRPCFGEAWQAMFAALLPRQPPLAARVSWRRWWRLHTLRPEQRRMFGFEQRHSQPAACLKNGIRISLY